LELHACNPGGTAAYFNVPFDVKQAYGTQARVAVRGTIRP